MKKTLEGSSNEYPQLFFFFLGNMKKYPSVIISYNRVVFMGNDGIIKSVMPCFCRCTRDSQKVCGHFWLLSHLLNVFKFYFIFRKRCFHSLINTNIKPITAAVPEKIDFEYAWGSHGGTRQIWDWRHQTLSRNWPEIPCIFIKTDNPRKPKTYICIQWTLFNIQKMAFCR